MPRFSDDFMLQLYDTCDIEQTVGQYTQLRRSGRHLIGLCPFHNERTPSFVVYPQTHSYYCFGCGAAGTVVQFIQQAENLDFYEAVKLLCDRYGLNMPQDKGDDTLASQRRRMYEINKEAAKFFHDCLMSDKGKNALNYYYSRGYSQSTINHFGMGYAPNEWNDLRDHMRKKGYSYEELYNANLVKKSEKNGKVNYYDNFRNRVMVPIIDPRGNIVAFGGRVLDDSKPKYINTSDTLVYKKSNGVFGLNYAKNSKEDFLIVVEGYMDVISLHQAGFINTIACLGTALTTEMAHLISRYTHKVYLSYDADEAGQKATMRAIEIFSSIGLEIKVVRLVGGKDPDEILKTHGPERYKALLEGSSNEVEFELFKIKGKYDLSTDDGRLKYLSEACSFLAQLNNTLAAEVYGSKLAKELDLDSNVINQRIASLRNNFKRRKMQNESSENFRRAEKLVHSVSGGVGVKSVKAQERIIIILAKNPDFYKYISSLSSNMFSDLVLRNIFTVINNRLAENRSVDEQLLASDLNIQDYQRLKAIMVRDGDLPSTRQELLDCIDVLKTEKPASSEKDDVSDEDFSNFFKNRANN